MIFNEIKFTYLFHRSYVRIFRGGKCHIMRSAKIRNSKVFVHPGASLKIEDNCIIENARIYVEKGCIILRENSIVKGDKLHDTEIIINNGNILMGDHSKLSCKRVWVRFGGKLEIGSYTNINEGSEIRCDEKISIGSFNQISYNVKIWDTNTHNILPVENRRKIAIDKFPYFGYESSKPITSPINIGDDCWIGENSTIFKGTKIGNECILGFGTFISGKTVPDHSIVVNETKLRIFPNEI